MASEKARRQLYEAVAAHRADLEVERGFTGLELKLLDRRIEDTRLLLEWLEQALELPPEVSTGLKHLLRPGGRAPSNVVFADFLSRSVGNLQTARAARASAESQTCRAARRVSPPLKPGPSP
jgi:hypothetical protein